MPRGLQPALSKNRRNFSAGGVASLRVPRDLPDSRQLTPGFDARRCVATANNSILAYLQR